MGDMEAKAVFEPRVLEGMFDDPGTVERHLRRFVPHHRADVEALDSLFQQGDLAAVEQQLHRIRSAALMVGAEEIAAVAARAEQRASDGDVVGSAAVVAQLPEALEQLVTAIDRYTEGADRP